MLAAVVNTSAGSRNAQRKNAKSANSLTNPRYIRPVLSPLTDGKEKIGDNQTRAACVQDYFPCFCYWQFVWPDNYFDGILCENVSVKTVRDVFQRFNNTEIYSLDFRFPIADATNTISLPADFLGNTSVTNSLYIIGLYSNFSNLIIDPLAFRSSQNSLAQFVVAEFDFGLQKDFSFLNGFNKLETLNIASSNNFTAFQYLPPLPSLQILKIESCPDFNQIPFPILSPAKLKTLHLYNSEISDEKIDEIVAKLVDSNSADSLETFYLYSNSLTRIPSQVGSAFPKLQFFVLAINNISHIPSASLPFASPYLEELYLNRNQIKTIESGAFRGKSTGCSSMQTFLLWSKKQNT